MSVTFPRGYLAAGAAVGFKASGRPDLGLLVSEPPARAVGLFTRNAFAAAPVILTRRHLAASRTHAVVVNSGQANAGTGQDGLLDAERHAALTAEQLGCRPQGVAVCSTGVIGPRVPMDVYEAGLPRVAGAVTADGGAEFAEAILTTDRRPKQATAEAHGIRVGGCAKGAGMIAPDLATLLVFLTSDAEASPRLLERVLREEVAPVWNGVTVDGCSSTNDTVLLLANGAAEAPPVPDRGPRARGFAEAVREVCEDLARLVVLDAEGSNHAIVVLAQGGVSSADAALVADAVASSLLVKTAVFGADPNPGRILQAVGASGAGGLDPAALSASIGDVRVIHDGRVVPFDDRAANRALKEQEVVIRVSLGDGPGTATAFGCDLGYEYVRINAEYTT